MSSHRAERVEEAIREAMSEILLYEFRDPRMPAVFNITGVRVTPDLQLARILFSQIPDDDDSIEETLEVLEHAAGFLRRGIAHRVRLRYTPELQFFFDEQLRAQRRVEELLDEAKARNSGPAPTEEKTDEDD